MAAITDDQATGCLMGQPACNATGLVPTLGDLDDSLFALYSELPPPCGVGVLSGGGAVSAAGAPVSFFPAAAFGPKRGCCGT